MKFLEIFKKKNIQHERHHQLIFSDPWQMFPSLARFYTEPELENKITM